MSLDLLRRGLKISHLRLLGELAVQSRLTDAARSLGMTQPAASRLISEIERITEANLYVRSGRGIELTDVGRKLADRCVRILQEFGDAGRDIEQHKSGQSGHVSIGSVTGPAIEYILPALRHIRLSYPDISISVDVAPSRDLAPKLEDGRLDFSLSRVPVEADPGLFQERPLLREPASIVARIGHPLTRAGTPIPAEALLGFDWVLPPVGAPIRLSAEQALREKGLSQPTRVLTTSSFLFTLATVQRTNAIAPVAQSVAISFAEGPDGAPGSLIELQSDLHLSVETYSFLTRQGQILTPVAQTVAREVLRAVGGQDGA
ncbi:LysR substrate-binding domain-containing protein [Roseibium sp. AS2]|uniref:LysR family transcriptional regulator n=1 Tax=Roseibium sp. AS2 TaxID=3135781 RepID=UPI0031769B55